jgi:hypothetical protein
LEFNYEPERTGINQMVNCPHCNQPMQQSQKPLSATTKDTELLDLCSAVDEFATVMKHKLAQKRAEGYAGWRTIDVQESFLSRIGKYIGGDKTQIIDIANYAMMIWYQSQHP